MPLSLVIALHCIALYPHAARAFLILYFRKVCDPKVVAVADIPLHEGEGWRVASHYVLIRFRT